jgi:protein TonB
VSRRADIVTAAIAVVFHGAIGVAMLRDTDKPRARPRTIEVEFRRPKAAPPPPAPPRALPVPTEPVHAARAPRRKLALAEPRPTPAPAAATPAPRPAAPAPPQFGIAMDSPVAADSPVSAPVGGTTRADPGSPRAARGGGAASAGSEGDATTPVSELEIKVMPEIDTDACGRTITYPDDAAKSGVQGDVRLRVTLDQRGRVRAARVLSGLGHGLDQAAVEALTHRCRFTPAIAKDGRAVPFVVESYTFHFELPR